MAVAHLVPAVGTGSGAPQKWAYGSNTWVNTTSITSTYSLHEVLFYGSQVVTTATNTSNSTVELKAVSAYNYDESYVYCAPNCTHPTSAYYNLTLDEWALYTSFVNVTSTATVYEASSTAHSGYVAAPAYGLSNGTWLASSNLSERYLYDVNGSLNYQGSYFTSTNSSYSADFSPALGLIPWNLSAHLAWNATSNLMASYLGLSACYVSYAGQHHYDILEHGNAYARWTIPETESVMGRDMGNTTLSNGQNVTQVDLGFQGAVDVSNGIFATPVNEDLFGGATANWSVGVIAGALATTPSLFVAHPAGSHAYQLVASTAQYTSMVRVVGLSRQASVALPASLATPTSGSSQSQPEPVVYAEAMTRCLVNQCSIVGSTSPLPASSGYAFPVWIWAGAAAGVVVAALLLFKLRRRPTGPAPDLLGKTPARDR